MPSKLSILKNSAGLSTKTTFSRLIYIWNEVFLVTNSERSYERPEEDKSQQVCEKIEQDSIKTSSPHKNSALEY